MNKLTIIEGKYLLVLFQTGKDQVRMNMEGLTDEGIKVIWDSVVTPERCDSAILYGFHKLDFPIFEKEGFKSATNDFIIMCTHFND